MTAPDPTHHTPAGVLIWILPGAAPGTAFAWSGEWAKVQVCRGGTPARLGIAREPISDRCTTLDEARAAIGAWLESNT